MKSLDQIIKDPSIIIMVIVMLMVKIVVIIILASTYWAPCVKHYVSVFHIVLGKHCVFRLFFSQHFWPQIVWAFLWHWPVLWCQLGVLQFSSDTVCLELISDSPGEGCGPARLSPLQTPVASPECHLCFWPVGCPSEVLMTVYLDSVNLLGWLTEPRKTVYVLGVWCITKDIKGYIRWGPEGSWTQEFVSLLSLGCTTFQHLDAFLLTNLEAFQTHVLRICGGFTM